MTSSEQGDDFDERNIDASTTLSTLPIAVLEHLFQFLDIADIRALCEADSYLDHLLKSNSSLTSIMLERIVEETDKDFGGYYDDWGW